MRRTNSVSILESVDRVVPVAFGALEVWVDELPAAGASIHSLPGFTEVKRWQEQHDVVASFTSGAVEARVRAGDQTEAARFVAKHGAGVADVEIVHPDPTSIAELAIDHGLDVTETPSGPRIDVTGTASVFHTVKSAPSGLAGNGPYAARLDGSEFAGIDHMSLCLPHGTADAVSRTYRQVFGLEPVNVGALAEVGPPGSGMRTMVLRLAGVTVVLTEPLCATGNGQTQRFVDEFSGPGVQHVAVASHDIIDSVTRLRRDGIRFQSPPDEYFGHAEDRLKKYDLPWDQLKSLGILVDADCDGLLFQVFTHPSEGTRYFTELIQRDGTKGFGEFNVRALFDALDDERCEVQQ